MKGFWKIKTAILMLFLLVSLAGCSTAGNQQSQSPSGNPDTSESTTSEQPIKEPNSSTESVSSLQEEVASSEDSGTDALSSVNSSEVNSSADTKPDGSGGVLVAYFTRTNNTKTVAELIHGQVGGDLFQIRTVEAYPEDYSACVDLARKEKSSNARPPLSSVVEDMDAYDVIYLGYPLWDGTIPMPVATFLESNDFSGKTIIPFCTHGGSRFGTSQTLIAELAPQATMLDGFEVSGGSASSAGNSITAWLSELGQPVNGG